MTLAAWWNGLGRWVQFLFPSLAIVLVKNPIFLFLLWQLYLSKSPFIFLASKPGSIATYCYKCFTYCERKQLGRLRCFGFKRSFLCPRIPRSSGFTCLILDVDWGEDESEDESESESENESENENENENVKKSENLSEC